MNQATEKVEQRRGKKVDHIPTIDIFSRAMVTTRHFAPGNSTTQARYSHTFASVQSMLCRRSANWSEIASASTKASRKNELYAKFSEFDQLTANSRQKMTKSNNNGVILISGKGNHEVSNYSWIAGVYSKSQKVSYGHKWIQRS